MVRNKDSKFSRNVSLYSDVIQRSECTDIGAAALKNVGGDSGNQPAIEHQVSELKRKLDEIKNFLKVCYQTLRWNEVSEWRHILGTKSAFKRGMMNFDFRKLAQFWICLAKGRFFSESMMNFSYCQKKFAENYAEKDILKLCSV